MLLTDRLSNRDNNFNLIRAVAAFAVLVSHSYALADGPRATDPLAWLHLTLGTVAVHCFFVASGFLVTSSLLSRPSVKEFLCARALRIYPALWLMLAVTVLGMAAFATSQPLSEYLTSKVLCKYLARNAVLVTGVKYELPGVFEGNPWPRAVNGSLWTMPYEVRMYLILAMMWVLLGLVGRRQMMTGVLITACLGAAMFCLSDHDWIHHSAQLFYMFFAGAALRAVSGRVVLTHLAFWWCASALIISSLKLIAFYFVYLLTLPYLVLYLAYVPNGPVRAYNKVGDYSYGIYLYAFPVQQTVAWLLPGVSVLSLTALSGACTISLAVLSWHSVERRMLHLKIASNDRFGATRAQHR